MASRKRCLQWKAVFLATPKASAVLRTVSPAIIWRALARNLSGWCSPARGVPVRPLNDLPQSLQRKRRRPPLLPALSKALLWQWGHALTAATISASTSSASTPRSRLARAFFTAVSSVAESVPMASANRFTSIRFKASLSCLYALIYHVLIGKNTFFYTYY